MAMSVLKIPCARCSGSGSVALSTKLTQVLRALRVLRVKASPKDIHAAIVKKYGGEFGVTAVCNRLEELRAMKFVDREAADGKGWLYFRTTQPDDQHNA